MNNMHPLQNQPLIFNGKAIEDPVAVDNCVLVEFFGSHDFGWIKLDSLAPYPRDGAFVPPRSAASQDQNSSAPTAAERARREKYAQPHNPAVKEALSSFSALEAGDTVAKGDDSAPPTMEELQEIHNLVQSVINPFGKSSSSGSRRSDGGTATAVLKGLSGPQVKIPKAFGELVNVTGPGSVSIHALSTADLGISVPTVKEVIQNNSFRADKVQLHYGLSKQDRALWRTRIMATALDMTKPVAPDQNIIRPRAPEPKGRRTSGSGGKSLTESREKELVERFTSRFASANSTTRKKINAKGGEALMDKHPVETAVPVKPVYINPEEMVEMVKVNTAQLYSASAETGRKWMMGISAEAEIFRKQHSVTREADTTGGVLHTRTVNMDSALFNKEASSAEMRKKLLRKEIEELDALLKWMKSKADKGEPSSMPQRQMDVMTLAPQGRGKATGAGQDLMTKPPRRRRPRSRAASSNKQQSSSSSSSSSASLSKENASQRMKETAVGKTVKVAPGDTTDAGSQVKRKRSDDEFEVQKKTKKDKESQRHQTEQDKEGSGELSSNRKALESEMK